jgi:hypothetical protein
VFTSQPSGAVPGPKKLKLAGARPLWDIRLFGQFLIVDPEAKFMPCGKREFGSPLGDSGYQGFSPLKTFARRFV